MGSLDELRKYTQLLRKRFDHLKKKADEALKEIERLRSELEAVKVDENKQKEYTKAVDILRAIDWWSKGSRYYLNKEYDKALEAYASAIALDPNNAFAYRNRGLT